MGLTMKRILDRYDDCNKFSLTGSILGYKITEEEFLNAILKCEEFNKEEKRKFYEKNKDKIIDYPEFDDLYDEIKQECYAYDSEENREFYINKYFNDNKIKQYKDFGMTKEDIEKMKNNFFHCTSIVDQVGKTTKYGKEYPGFFWHLYHDIAMNIDRQKNKESYFINTERNPLESIPEELKEYFLYYEISYFNSVTMSSGLMINYYFNLNEDTKKYLLKFRNDFCIDGLEDLTLYKDDEMKFYSCTHEEYNSIEFDYKNMSSEEIIDFINDEYYEENNDKVIEIVSKIINMNDGMKFSFKEIGINSKILMDKIYRICDLLGLRLISYRSEEQDFSQITEDIDFKKVLEISPILCDVDDIIVKKSDNLKFM